MNFTLKTRILTLYDENKKVVDTVITRLGSPQIDNDSVGKFTKLRDSKTHAGAFEWGDRAAIYYPLLAMEYSIYLKLAGIPESEIIKMLECVF